MKDDNKLQNVINKYGNNKNVETKSSTIHSVLENAGLIPGAGMAPDLANAALYGLEGDGKGALMSLLAAIPGLGIGATVGKKANKARVRLDKEGKIIKDKEFSDNFDALSREVEDVNLEHSDIFDNTPGDFKDSRIMREEARKIIKRLRESKTLDDIRKILGQFD